MVGKDDFSYAAMGDTFGIDLLATDASGTLIETLAIWDGYIYPLFRSHVLGGKPSTQSGDVPRILQEWNTLSGWRDSDEPTDVLTQDALHLAEWLSTTVESDIEEECDGDEYRRRVVRCSHRLAEFLTKYAKSGHKLSITVA